MTNPAILDALTEVIMNTPGDPHSYGPTVHDARAFAAAVLELVGPKPLQFADEMGDGVLTSREKRTLYRCFPQEDGRFFVSHCGFFPTLEAAQAAAQAHADAAHWANTKIGGK